MPFVEINVDTYPGNVNIIDETMHSVAGAYNASMPKKANEFWRQLAYWWTEEIAALRRKTLALRRKAQRKRKRGFFGLETRFHRDAKKALKKAILASEHGC